MTLYQLRKRLVEPEFPESLLRDYVINVLSGLRFLHTDAGVVHTGSEPHRALVA